MPIHPYMADKFRLIEGIDSWEAGFADPVTLARLKEFTSNGDTPPLPSVDIDSDAAPGAHGPVPLWIYRPIDRGAALACLIWLHGGSFRVGDLDMPEADWVAREICHRLRAVVVSVDYRLAVNGVTYPVPHDDAAAATPVGPGQRQGDRCRPRPDHRRRSQRRWQPRGRRHTAPA